MQPEISRGQKKALYIFLTILRIVNKQKAFDVNVVAEISWHGFTLPMND